MEGVPLLDPRVRRGWLAGILVALLLTPSPVRAGSCPLDGLPPFAGHAFPLQPQLGTIGFSKPFPLLADFARPIFLTAEPPPPVPEDFDRIYVVQQRGLVRVFENRPDVDDPDVSVFPDLSNIDDQFGSELGLLGMAFDPDFWSNGYFYVNYTTPGANCTAAVRCTKVVRYEAAGSPPALVGDGDPTVLLEFTQPFGNHNGGMLAFGPDGMLYVAIGDGGDAGDPLDSGQDTSTILGSLARIDPHDPANDYIPSDNPFAGQVGFAQEIFHYGLRNPWRFSFDRGSGDLWIGDVGQGAWEEIDYAPAGTPGGLNFGWRDCEGAHRQLPYTCDLNDPDLTFPVLEYPHNSTGGFSVTGGYVYRGSRAPSLYGAYLYADYVSERLWAWDQVSASPVVLTVGGVPEPSSFGEDQHGELYVVSLAGGIYWFDELAPGAGGGPPPALLSQTGLFDDVATLDPADGLLPYAVNARLWSDRARKFRWLALPAGETVAFAATDAWTYPVGTAFVKHFELELAPGVFRRLETRVLLRQESGWVGHTYRWNAQETDAERLEGALDETFDVALPGLPATQTWHYPGPTECLGCHTNAGGRVLGARTRQLNRSYDYTLLGGDAANQLEAWSCAGLLLPAVVDASVHGAYAGIGDLAANHERARSHLASNCEFCHQPGAPAPGGLDLRFDTGVDDMNLLDVPASEGDLGSPGALRVEPGEHADSVLWRRMDASNPAIRMAKGTRTRHLEALAVIADWIDVDLVDPDADGLRSFEDNCPLEANGPLAGPNLQDDSDLDGAGDVCECSYAPGQAVVGDGDFDRSGATDGADLAILDGNFGQAVASFDEGDADCNGVADGADYTIWADD